MVDLNIEKVSDNIEILRDDNELIGLRNQVGISYPRGLDGKSMKKLKQYAKENNAELIDFSFMEFIIIACSVIP